MPEPPRSISDPLPETLSYRFRIPELRGQVSLNLPAFLSRSRIHSLYLEQAPNRRASLPCAHSLWAMLYYDGTLAFNFGGLAGYAHHREDDLARAVREVTQSVFGPATTNPDPLLENELDRYSIVYSAPDKYLPEHIQECVRRLAQVFPVTRGRIGYVRRNPPR